VTTGKRHVRCCQLFAYRYRQVILFAFRQAESDRYPLEHSARPAPAALLAEQEIVTVTERYLEDFAVGQTFGSGRLRIDRDRIKAFAAEFDPQPFHLDEEAARDSIFRGLAASGWHTAALTMRLLVESELKPAGGIVGTGFDEFRWPRPVRPGDELRVESEVLEVRSSKSRPDQGLIKVRTTTLNQDGETVQISIGNLLVPRRPE
jgi:acyl dehydratase